MTVDKTDRYIVSWREAAACTDRTDIDFFADPDDLVAVAGAKATCETCLVAGECLSWAIEMNQTEGIWGGYTAKERRSIRRQWIEQIRRAS